MKGIRYIRQLIYWFAIKLMLGWKCNLICFGAEPS